MKKNSSFCILLSSFSNARKGIKTEDCEHPQEFVYAYEINGIVHVTYTLCHKEIYDYDLTLVDEFIHSWIGGEVC